MPNYRDNMSNEKHVVLTAMRLGTGLTGQQPEGTQGDLWNQFP